MVPNTWSPKPQRQVRFLGPPLFKSPQIAGFWRSRAESAANTAVCFGRRWRMDPLESAPEGDLCPLSCPLSGSPQVSSSSVRCRAVSGPSVSCSSAATSSSMGRCSIEALAVCQVLATSVSAEQVCASDGEPAGGLVGGPEAPAVRPAPGGRAPWLGRCGLSVRCR